MRIPKWEQIINPKTYSKKGKKKKRTSHPEKKDPVKAEETTASRRKETIEEMFERRTIQSEIGLSGEQKERKMKVRDFDIAEGDKERHISRIKALAETYPFMFEKDFLEELKKLEEKKTSEQND